MSHGLAKTVKIGFIFQQSVGWMGGITYCRNLFYALSQINEPKLIPYIFEPEDEIAKKTLSPYCELVQYTKSKDIAYHIARISARLQGRKFHKNEYFDFINYKKLPVALTSHGESIENLPHISWIPDFQHIKLPEMFSEEELEFRNKSFRQTIEKSDIVILSSYDALKDFENFAPNYKDKARVLQFVSIVEKEVYEKTDQLQDIIIAKYKLPKKYFYLPNQFWRHKNHKIVFEAISLLKQQDIEISLVCTGSTKDFRHSDFMQELAEIIDKNSLQENIRLLGLVDFIEVHYLMRNSVSIINPSLFEGWSSTVEEAKSLGKNIILSNLPVHIEQNPPHGTYFDPTNAEELAKILKQKWLDGASQPDYELEKQAKENLASRIQTFGKTYQDIVIELIKS